MRRKFKTIWGILTGNLLTGYISVGLLPDGRADIILSSYKVKGKRKVDYSRSVILPTNTIIYIPKLTEGRIETPDEWIKRERKKNPKRG